MPEETSFENCRSPIDQNFILPSAILSLPSNLYYKHELDKTLTWPISLVSNDFIDWKTYFNALNVRLYNDFHGSRCQFGIYFEYIGKIKIKIESLEDANHVVMEETLSNSSTQYQKVSLPINFDQDVRLIGLTIQSFSNSSIKEIKWQIQTINQIPYKKLGIVITHFNRQNYVVPALQRFAKEFDEDPNFAKFCELIVIDNSQNLPLINHTNIHLIPNKNLGGSGGFTRGLLEIIHKGNIGYCLFMDDDGTCEIESIKRTLALLRISKDPELAVAGSLLIDTQPHLLFEKSAYFDTQCHPLHQGQSIDSPLQLLEAEKAESEPNQYGAWWFFGFNIKQVKHFPYPFFVRGDDILFSLMNKFKIMTSIGIGVWGEDFEEKQSPMTTYLDTRSQLLISHTQSTAPLYKIILNQLKALLIYLTSFRYSSADAQLLALQDYIESPKNLIEDPSGSIMRARLQVLQKSEAYLPIASSLPKLSANAPLNFYQKLLIILIPGFSIPKSFLRDLSYFEKTNMQRLYIAWRSASVISVNSRNNTFLHLKMNRKKSLALVIRFLTIMSKFILRSNSLRKEHQKNISIATQPDYWKTVFES